MLKKASYICLCAFLVFSGCDMNPARGEKSDTGLLSLPGSSDEERQVYYGSCEGYTFWAKASDALKRDVPSNYDTYLCIWTSGTYNETGTWDFSDPDLAFTVSSDGELEIEFFTGVCRDEVNTRTAYAVYFPANEKKGLNYDLYASIDWGYLPPIIPGDCWFFIADCVWSGLPHSHGISVTVDWASAESHSGALPPIDLLCGWPLVGWAPPPFTINGL